MSKFDILRKRFNQIPVVELVDSGFFKKSL